VIPVSGTIVGKGNDESVAISGNVVVLCTMVNDPTFSQPSSMRQVLDFSAVTGRGVKSGALYSVPDINIKIRPLQKSDSVQITFPLFLASSGMMTARTGMASFNLSYNAGQGKVTGGTATIGSNTF